MLNGPESTLFCRGTGSIRGRPIFFFFRSVPLLLSKIKISIFKKNAHRAGNWEQIICTGYCDVDRLHRKEMCSITVLLPNILSIVFKYLVACLMVERHHEALI